MTLTTLRLSSPYGMVALRDAGAGQPVVLIHGVGLQSAAWGPQIEALSQTHRVLALDMPGHGDSDPLAAGADLTDFVAWLHAVLTALDLGPVSLAGHSMGALVAAGYAVCHPDMIRRVALLNGVYRRSEAARAAVIARAAAISDGHFDLETPLCRWFGDSAPDQAARAKVSAWLAAVDIEGYATAYTAFAKGDATFAERLPEIACPFLAITGDEDRNSSPAMAMAMADAVRHGTAVVFKGHRHMVNLTAPAQVNSALRDWLETEAAGATDG